MRQLPDVINQILEVSTNYELKERLEKIKFDCAFTAPEVMDIRWDLTHEALCRHYPNPIGDNESIEVFCIFTTMNREQLITAVNGG
ncbi:TPA: hypothetical protein ACGXM3_005295 [Bacillus cereus]